MKKTPADFDALIADADRLASAILNTLAKPGWAGKPAAEALAMARTLNRLVRCSTGLSEQLLTMAVLAHDARDREVAVGRLTSLAP